MNKIILLLLLGIVFVSSCSRGYTQNEVVALCDSQHSKGLKQGIILGESCSESTKLDIFQRAKDSYLQESINSFRQDCLLIVTEGENPREVKDRISNINEYFEIRTLNITSDQIEDRWDDSDFNWKYYVMCK